jgi:hypothetical protein
VGNLKHLAMILLAVVAAAAWAWEVAPPEPELADPVKAHVVYKTLRTVNAHDGSTVTVLQPQNATIRCYALDGTSGAAIAPFSRPLDTAYWGYEKAGPRERKLVEGLLSTPGVEYVFVEPHRISVERAMAFRWYEVEPSVIDCILKTLGGTVYLPPREPDQVRVMVHSSYEDCVLYVNRQICEAEMGAFNLADGLPAADKLNQIGPAGTAIVSAMMKVKDVSSVFIAPYFVSTTLTHGRTWTPKMVRDAEEKLRCALPPPR